MFTFLSNWFNPLHTLSSAFETAQLTHHADTNYELATLEKYYYPGIQLLSLNSKLRVKALWSCLCPGYLEVVLRMLGGFLEQGPVLELGACFYLVQNDHGLFSLFS